LIQCRSNL